MKKPLLFFSISEEEKIYFLENLSMMLSAGISVMPALSIMRKEVRTKGMRFTIDVMAEDINSGTQLWQAFQETKLFPKQAISLIKIGEKTGKLKENFETILSQMRKDSNFRSKIKSAMTYPMLVLSVTLGVGIMIAWFILPKLSQVFSNLQIKLPGSTQALINFGNFLAKYGAVAVPAFLIILFFFVWLIFFFSKTKFIGESILFVFPATKRVIQEIEVARFGYILGMLLQAGLPITEAIESLEDATDSRMYKNFAKELKNRITDGQSFAEVFDGYKKSSKLIPLSIQQMIIAAESSGTVSTTLLNIGKIFEEKVDNTIKDLTVILEPVLLVIVWVGVVSVAFAVILPIYSLMGQLNETSGSQSIQSSAPAIMEIKPDQAPTISANQKIIVVPAKAGGIVNVRENPTTTANIILKAQDGEVYDYISEAEGWVQIKINDNQNGWIFSKFAKPNNAPVK